MLGRLAPRNTIDLPWVRRYDTDIDTAAPTWAGQHVTTETATQLLVVYGAAAFHADHLSTMPIDQVRELPSGDRVSMRREVWLDEPYPGLDITDCLSQLWWSYWIGGHALALVNRNDSGRVSQLLPLHPSTWDLRDERGQPALYVNGRKFGGEYLSVPHTLMPGCWKGINPIEAARQSIGTGLAAAEYGARFFGQGTTLSGVIQMPGAAPGPDELKLMRESWVKTYGGSGRAHLPGLLFGGATWQQISVTPEQAQFLETRRFTDAQIASLLFHLPPSTLGIPVEGGATVQYQNIESAWAEVVRRWLPHKHKMQRAMSKLLPRPQFVTFNADRYLEATTKERFDTYKVGIDSGVLTPNEARRKEDMPPLPGGDEPRGPSSTVSPAMQALAAPPRAADEPAPPPVVVQMPPVQIDVHPQVDFSSLPPPVVNVEPAVVNVAAPQVTVEAPIVTVEPPEVTIEPPDVHIGVMAPLTRKRIVRDPDGNIIEVVEEAV